MNNPQDCLIQPQRKELRLPTLYSVTVASFPIELPKGSTELARTYQRMELLAKTKTCEWTSPQSSEKAHLLVLRSESSTSYKTITEAFN